MSIEPSWRVCPDEITPSHVCPTETAAHHAARLLAQGPGRDWRLRDLANLVHLSTSQLGRAFSQSFGMPPMRYLAHVRAHRLAELLVETDLPIGVAMAQPRPRRTTVHRHHRGQPIRVPTHRDPTSKPEMPVLWTAKRAAR